MTVEELRKLKREKGITNLELAEASGVPIGTINKIFSGETKNPRFDTLMSIYYALLQALPKSKRDSADANAENFRGHHYLHEEAPYYPTISSRKRGINSVEDYYLLPDDKRAELIDGKFYDMAAPSLIHQYIAGEVFFQIKDYIRNNDGKCVPMIAPLDVRFSEDDPTVVEPDIMVVCDNNKIRKDGILGAPDLIIEIVSATSKRLDYVIKLEKYQREGVREYMIIDPIKKMILKYDIENDGTPTIYLFEGCVPIGIYHEQLVLQFDAIRAYCDNFNKEV